MKEKKKESTSYSSKRKFEKVQTKGEVRRSSQLLNQKNFGPDFYVHLVDKDLETFDEAMSSHDAPFWSEVVDDDMHITQYMDIGRSCPRPQTY